MMKQLELMRTSYRKQPAETTWLQASMVAYVLMAG